MPLNKSIRKVMVIGSGPIVIGQAAEFDYAGTQACRALKEDGLEVVLVNSNPATIMTDSAMADRIYIEPLTLPVIKRIIEKERPDSLLSTLGGQTGLTLSMQLAKDGFLEQMGVRLLGASQGQLLAKVIWPACLPWLLTSLRTGLGLSLSGAIVGEYLGSTKGMGWLLSAAGDVFNSTRVLCCVLVLVVLIIALDAVVHLLEWRLLRWRG